MGHVLCKKKRRRVQPRFIIGIVPSNFMLKSHFLNDIQIEIRKLQMNYIKRVFYANKLFLFS